MKTKTIKKGGQLMLNPTDLQNTHLCGDKMTTKYRESPGYEVYMAISDSFQLNNDTVGYFLTSFRKINDKWFKFVIFNNDNIEYIYIINGAPINKHSVCFIDGILEVTKNSGEYSDIRDAYNKLQLDKGYFGIDNASETNDTVINLNNAINASMQCMPVIAAGSGTVNDDGTICINTKSGHYKPSINEMDKSKILFEKITNKQVIIVLKENKEALINKYGDRADQYSGICL